LVVPVLDLDIRSRNSVARKRPKKTNASVPYNVTAELSTVVTVFVIVANTNTGLGVEVVVRVVKLV
jgi:hypothetical protein